VPKTHVPRQFELRTQRYGNTSVVRLTGELDMACEQHFEQAMRALEESGGSIVIDLTDLAFIDSTGLRLLIGAHERFRARGDRLVVVPGDGAVRRTLELTGLHRVLSLAGAGSSDDIATAATDQGLKPAA
jgi:anti-anti-sigma factor